MGSQTSTRRRGDRLQQAIFKATLVVVERDGYLNTTFNKIAQEAKTSRSVIYNHWSSPLELIVAASHDQRRQTRQRLSDQTFDSGNLQQDLVNLATFFIDANRVDINSILVAALKLNDDAAFIKNLIQSVKQADLQAIDKILAQAKQRGDITAEPSETAKLLLFDLLRYNTIIRRDQAIPELIEQIVLPALLYEPSQKTRA